MKPDAFNELLESVRQAGAIRRGERKPARVRAFKPADVKRLRAELGQLHRPQGRGRRSGCGIAREPYRVRLVPRDLRDRRLIEREEARVREREQDQ